MGNDKDTKSMKQGRKFTVLIIMTVVNILYIVGSIIKPDVVKLMTLVMSLNVVYGGYMGVNVWQKKKNETTNNN